MESSRETKQDKFWSSREKTRQGPGSSRETRQNKVLGVAETRQGPGSSRETKQNKVLGVAEGQDEVLERSRETGQSSGE